MKIRSEHTSDAPTELHLQAGTEYIIAKSLSGVK